MSTKKLILILILATVVAYFSSLGNPFIWDDEQFIVKNIYVQNFDIQKIFTTNTVAGAGVVSNYYRPLTTLSFAIDTKIWGTNTFGFHLTNITLHIGAGILLFLLLLELFKSCHSEASAEESRSFAHAQAIGSEAQARRDDKRKTSHTGLYPAFFVALFFLVHPVQVEAVTYINSRGDSMYAFFLFLSLYLFTRGLLGRFGRLGVLGWLGVVGTFLCSLLSKEIALAGVGLFFLILFICQGRTLTKVRPWKNRALWVVGVIVGITVVYFLLRLGPLNFGNTLNFYGFENEYTRSLAIRMFTFAKVLWVYFSLLVWPYPLHMERSISIVISFLSPWVLGMLGLLGSIGVLGVWQVRKNNPWILFGLVWFLGMLVPGSGIIPINGILYEHWLYVPSIGLWLMAYGIGKFTIFNLQFSINFQSTIYKIMTSFVIVISILYIVLTIRQNNIWSDPITFYSYTIPFAPMSARLHSNFGMSYADAGNNKKAVEEYKKALSITTYYPQAHNNLANAYEALGMYPQAEEEFRKALQIDPNFAVAKINLLDMYLTSKQFTKALPLLIEFERYYTKDIRYQFNYGFVLWNLGRKDEAEKRFTQALLLSGNNPQVLQAIQEAKK